MTRSSRLRLAALAAAAALLAPGAALAVNPGRPTQPVNATKDDFDPQRTYSAPALAVSPDNPNVVVGGYLEFRTKRCSLMRSTDAGATWKFLDASPTLPSYPFCLANNSNVFQAPIAFGRNNTLYMAMAAWDTQDTRNQVSVQLARSTDLGDSWTPVLVRDARATKDPTQESNRPITDVAVDTSGSTDVVYVTYRRAIVNQPTGSSAPSQPMVAVSTDGGKTFSEPVSVVAETFQAAPARGQAIGAATTVPNTTTTTAKPDTLAAKPDQPANFGGSNPSVTVDAKGNAYVAWKSATANITPTPPPGIFVSKSTDKGKTWQVQQVRPFDYANGSPFVIPDLEWTPKGGAQGTLHMAYEGTDRPEVASYSTIYHLSSTDGGATWTEPKAVPKDDPKLMNGKFLPNLEVAPNGRLDLTWWDTRDDPGIRANDVYYSYSTDNGKTWSADIRVSDQTIDRRFGVWGNNFDQNSTPSLASTNAFALFAWDDTRFSRSDGEVKFNNPTDTEGIGAGVQDIFVSAVQFETLASGTSRVAKIILAGVIGLLAVGLVLLVAAFVTKGRTAPAADPAASARKTEAGVN